MIAFCWLCIWVCFYAVTTTTNHNITNYNNVTNNIVNSNDPTISIFPTVNNIKPYEQQQLGTIEMYSNQMMNELLQYISSNTIIFFVFIFILTLYSAAMSVSFESIRWIYPFEIFPFRARGKASSFLVGFQIITTTLVTFIWSNNLTIEINNVLIYCQVFFMISVVLCLFIYISIPETKGNGFIIHTYTSIYLYVLHCYIILINLVMNTYLLCIDLRLEVMEELFKIDPVHHCLGKKTSL